MRTEKRRVVIAGCDYIYGDASPLPPPPPPVCEDSGNVACHTAIATLGCDCGGAIANDCFKSCGCCAEQPPSPPPPTEVMIGLYGNDPQDEHTIKWNVNYVFQAYGGLIEIGDWICWQPIWAPNFEPPSSTPTTYCGTCIGGAYGFRVREGSDLALSSREFDTTIDLAGQDGTEEHTLELCLFKADQVTGPAPMPGATSTRYNNVKLHILHEPPSAPPPSPAAPVARPPAFPGLPSGVCWDHFTRMKEDGYDSFSGGDINIKCRNFAGDTCHNPDSEHFGCNSIVGHYCQRSCGCTFARIEPCTLTHSSTHFTMASNDCH